LSYSHQAINPQTSPKVLSTRVPGQDMKGSSPRNLIKYMRAFGEAWPDEAIVQQLVAQIPWGHNVVVSSLLCKLCSLVLGLRFGAGFESAPAIPAPEPALGSHSCVALYSGSGTFQFRPAILALNALNPRGSGTESPIQ